jgi:hypothetical protein
MLDGLLDRILFHDQVQLVELGNVLARRERESRGVAGERFEGSLDVAPHCLAFWHGADAQTLAQRPQGYKLAGK